MVNKKSYSTREFSKKVGVFSHYVQTALKLKVIEARKNSKGRWEIPEEEISKWNERYYSFKCAPVRIGTEPKPIPSGNLAQPATY